MRSKLPFRRQETPSSCAVACLRMILEHHGFVVSEAELRKRCQTSELGTLVENLLNCARALGFEAEKEIHLSEFLESWAFYDNMAAVLRR